MKKLAVAIVASALACGLSSAALAKHHAKHVAAAAPAAQAQSIPGVNPMTNAGPTPAVANPQPYTKVPGVNPM